MTARFSLASLILLLTLLFAGAALAVKPDEVLADPALDRKSVV
jgi:cytochrome c-type biogenesis protein CcmH